MCRCLARPPIATARLTETGDGNELRYELKKAWREGTRLVRLDPYELIARICAMVPPPCSPLCNVVGEGPGAGFTEYWHPMRSCVSKWLHRPNRICLRRRMPCQTQCNFRFLASFSRSLKRMSATSVGNLGRGYLNMYSHSSRLGARPTQANQDCL